MVWVPNAFMHCSVHLPSALIERGVIRIRCLEPGVWWEKFEKSKETRKLCFTKVPVTEPWFRMMQKLRNSKTLGFQKKLHPALFSSKERRELLRSSIDFLLKIDPLQVTHTAINVLRPFVLFSAHLNYSNYWKYKFSISIIQTQTYIWTSYEWTFFGENRYISELHESKHSPFLLSRSFMR